MSKRTCILGILLMATGAWAASEITANLTLKVTKGSLDVTRTAAQTLNVTANAPNVAGFTQLVNTNTAGTALTLGDVSTNGVAWFRNLSTNNYIEIGVQTTGVFYPLMRLNYGEAWTTRLAQGVTPYARANTADVVLEKLIFDN